MWLSANPAMGEYIPRAPIDDEARKYNENLPGMGGVFNYVNLHAYHYAGNNPVKLVDPDGRSPKTALKLIAKYSEQIKIVAEALGVDPVGIGSVIFQEKYHGIFAAGKNALAYAADTLGSFGAFAASGPLDTSYPVPSGVNTITPSTRSYGLAEMQLGLAAELLDENIDVHGIKERMYNLLKNDNWSIILIALNIRKNEKELGVELKGAAAGGAHNMGVAGYKAFLNGEQGLTEHARRSIEYQQAIQNALNGVIDTRKDNER
jgi:hypothetical protein